MVKEIILKQFPTHIESSDNIYKENQMVKLNNQKIYNGGINRFKRAIVVKNLHKYIASQLPKGISIQKYPIEIEYIIRTVRNHGDISWSKKRKSVIWKKKDNKYIPTWDADNLAVLWIKTINDTLEKEGIIVNDNVAYVRGGHYRIEFVEEFEDREIIIKFREI